MAAGSTGGTGRPGRALGTSQTDWALRALSAGCARLRYQGPQARINIGRLVNIITHRHVAGPLIANCVVRVVGGTARPHPSPDRACSRYPLWTFWTGWPGCSWVSFRALRTCRAWATLRADRTFLARCALGSGWSLWADWPWNAWTSRRSSRACRTLRPLGAYAGKDCPVLRVSIRLRVLVSAQSDVDQVAVSDQIPLCIGCSIVPVSLRSHGWAWRTLRASRT